MIKLVTFRIYGDKLVIMSHHSLSTIATSSCCLDLLDHPRLQVGPGSRIHAVDVESRSRIGDCTILNKAERYCNSVRLVFAIRSFVEQAWIASLAGSGVVGVRGEGQR
jgi:hypothetical protein